MATLSCQAVRWPVAGRTKTLASSGHRLRRPQDTRCLWHHAAFPRAVSAPDMAFANLGTSSIHGILSVAQLFPAQLAPLIGRCNHAATPFFSGNYPRSILLNELLTKFSSTRTPLALRNTYYSRTRGTVPARSGRILGGNWGSSGGGGGSRAWRRLKAAINALPQSVLVWGIIGANAIVFLGWQYAEQSYVRVQMYFQARLIPYYALDTTQHFIAATISGSETLSMDVPELHYKLGELATRYVLLENIHNDWFYVLIEHFNVRSCVSYSGQ
jgi:hypothetical protein